MGPHKLMLCLLLAGSIRAYAQQMPQDPEMPPKPPRDATSEDRRQYRIALRDFRHAERDSARRENNIQVGIAPSFNVIDHNPDGTVHAEETVPGFGFAFAYRTHFKSKLGVKAGTQFFMGSTSVEQTRDLEYPDGQSVDYYPPSSSGSSGSTYGFNTSVQAILGPFGRFALEPGVGVTWGAHTASAVALSGSGGDIAYAQDAHFSFYNGVLGASLYLGNKDQFSISPSLVFGLGTGARDDRHYSLNLVLAYAVQIPKG